MNASKSAYTTGFEAGYGGASVDDTPYRGHTTGFHRGLFNQWRRGCENGSMAASAKKTAFIKKDEASILENEGDNAMVRDDLKEAADLWSQAATKLRQAADDLKYHNTLRDTLKQPDRHAP
jgi:hypothetical protein